MKRRGNIDTQIDNESRQLGGGSQVKWLMLACLSYKYDQRRQSRELGLVPIPCILPVYVRLIN